MDKKTVNKEAIIAEYLAGDVSFRQLADKHGVDFRKIHYWVNRYRKNGKPLARISKRQLKTTVDAEPLPTDVMRLQAELRKAKLHTEVLEEMLKLSETLTGIELRKKFGAKQF